MPKIISVGTLKGGTGKTSFLFNMSGVLAEDKKVLLIDGDPQFNLTSNVGVDVTKPDLKSIKDVLENKLTANEVIYKQPIKSLPNLDIIPSSVELTLTELKLVNMPGRENKLVNFFKNNHDRLSEYDFILMDSNPNLGMINQNIFLSSDSILLISDIDMNSIRGAEFFLALWEEIRTELGKPDNVKGLILNNADMRSTLWKQLNDYCLADETLGKLLIQTIIPMNQIIKETEFCNQPINILGTTWDEKTKQYIQSGTARDKKTRQDIRNKYADVLLRLKERGVL